MKNIILLNPLKNKFGINKSNLKRNLLMIIFLSIFFGGIVYGALNGKKADSQLLQRLDFMFNTNYDIRCSKGVFSSFVSSFASSAIFLFIIFLLGLSLWGGIFSAVVPFLKGYGYGLAVGFLYNSYGIWGIIYNLLIILPGAFLCSLVIAAAAQDSFKNSINITSCFTKAAIRDDPQIQMKKYLLSMLWYLGLCAAASVIDMVCSFCFSWIFKF